MGTRGLYGYINGEKRDATYSSYDSYPESLGIRFYEACIEGNMCEYPLGEDNDIYFLTDSLFCEWAYFYDPEKRIFEVWKGWQTEPDPSNPYGCENRHGYYPCKMILRAPIDSIPWGIFDEDDFEKACLVFRRENNLDKLLE